MELDAAQRLYCEKALSRASERRAPISDELLQIPGIGPMGPGCSWGLVRISRPRQSFAQIRDGLVGNSQGEGLRLRCHRDLL